MKISSKPELGSYEAPDNDSYSVSGDNEIL